MKSTRWYRQLEDLAAVKIFEKNPLFLKDEIWIRLPGLWGIFYNVFFYWRIGKGVAILSVLFAAAMIIAISAQRTSVWAPPDCLFTFDKVGPYFWFSVLGFVWPMISAGCGTWVRWRSAAFVRYQMRGMPAAKKAKAEDLVRTTGETLAQEEAIAASAESE